MAEEVILPSLGQTTNELTIFAWAKKDGDEVTKGDVLLEVETDKAIVEVEAYASGILKGISYSEGDRVLVGTVLAWIVQAEEAAGFSPPLVAEGQALQQIGQAPPSARSPADRADAAAIAPASPSSPASPGSQRVRITPLAKCMAEQHGLPIAALASTGNGGVIKQRDVEACLAQQQAPGRAVGLAASCPAPGAAVVSTVSAASGDMRRNDKRIPLSSMRRTIGERLAASKSAIPHFYVTSHIDATKLCELREQLKPLLGRDVSYNSMIIRAAVAALRQYPAINASLQGNEIVEHGGIHIGLAVEVEDGLRVPVVRHADSLDLWALTDALRDVAQRAKENRLSVEEITGGTFTVSSLGMFGVDEFQAIVNPPEAAILAIGRISDQALVREGQLVAGKGITLSLSADHRIVDGAMAGRFMLALREQLEQPLKLLTPIVEHRKGSEEDGK